MQHNSSEQKAAEYIPLVLDPKGTAANIPMAIKMAERAGILHFQPKDNDFKSENLEFLEYNTKKGPSGKTLKVSNDEPTLFDS